MDEFVKSLLDNPELLSHKKPFFRGFTPMNVRLPEKVRLSGFIEATVPRIYRNVIDQSVYAMEASPYSHRVLFDSNIPSITVKMKKHGYMDIEQYRLGMPMQILIRDKQVRHLCVNRMLQILNNMNPTDVQNQNFIRYKQAWDEKNMEGAKTQFVRDQKTFGDAALLMYMGRDGRLHTRNISYNDEITIISHKNNNGEHVLECLKYEVDGYTVIDCYDDTYVTTFTETQNREADGRIIRGWNRSASRPHGFSEIPLITRRGDVAWERGQLMIEALESLLNTFVVIQKRHGWGMIYVKGKFSEGAKKLAGNVILNDNSGDPTSDAKILDPPSPDNMIETINCLEEQIQKACGTTWVLPKDIKMSGDTSGVAVELTQELDLATAQDGVIEWQNVANKMGRLFKEGLAMELVNTGENPNAITEYKELKIQNSFSVWKPRSEDAHNQMVEAAVGAGIISKQTAIEKNTLSTPDEKARIEREEKEKADKELEQKKAEMELDNSMQNSTQNIAE